MLDFVDRLTVLDPRIDDAEVVFEKGREVARRDMAVLIDRGRDHLPAVSSIPRGVVGPASEKRDSIWRAADDHEAESPASLARKTLARPSHLCSRSLGKQHKCYVAQHSHLGESGRAEEFHWFKLSEFHLLEVARSGIALALAPVDSKQMRCVAALIGIGDERAE